LRELVIIVVVTTFILVGIHRWLILLDSITVVLSHCLNSVTTRPGNEGMAVQTFVPSENIAVLVNIL
jgi:hypothetical protein